MPYGSGRFASVKGITTSLNCRVQEAAEKKKKMSRDARSETRRIQNVLSSMGEDLGDLLKFNQLQVTVKSNLSRL